MSFLFRGKTIDHPVAGFSLEQAVRCPEYDVPLVVIGAPLTIDFDSFRTAGGDIESTLREICRRVKGQAVK